MRIKKLAGKKCYLSPMKTEDAFRYAEFLNDDAVTEGLYLSAMTVTPENEKAFIEKASSEYDFSVIDNETDQLIGSVGLDNIDRINDTAEFGIFIGNRNFWNKGYGTEAASLILEYGFRRLNLHSVFLNVFSFNKKAIRCYEKVGFRMIGCRRGAVRRGGKYYDRFMMDILADDFYDLHPEFDRKRL